MGDAMVPGTMTQSTHRPRVEVQALLRAVAGREEGRGQCGLGTGTEGVESRRPWLCTWTRQGCPLGPISSPVRYGHCDHKTG